MVQQLGQQNGNLNPRTAAERLKMPDFRYSRTSIPANLDSSELAYLSARPPVAVAELGYLRPVVRSIVQVANRWYWL